MSNTTVVQNSFVPPLPLSPSPQADPFCVFLDWLKLVKTHLERQLPIFHCLLQRSRRLPLPRLVRLSHSNLDFPSQRGVPIGFPTYRPLVGWAIRRFGLARGGERVGSLLYRQPFWSVTRRDGSPPVNLRCTPNGIANDGLPLCCLCLLYPLALVCLLRRPLIKRLHRLRRERNLASEHQLSKGED